jgi:hypothetical protein
MKGKGLSEDMTTTNTCRKFSNQGRGSFAEVLGKDSERSHTRTPIDRVCVWMWGSSKVLINGFEHESPASTADFRVEITGASPTLL